jgi:hypothetical protein
MASQQIYNFKPGIHGDTYPEISFNIKVNGINQDLSGCVIRMWLKPADKDNLQEIIKYETTNGKVVITNPTGGNFKIVFGMLTMTPRLYNHDIEIGFPTGLTKTWIKGNFKILNDTTQ